ncbi:hypothetical protein ACE1TI_04985 [Alteribacillus sp. JSM 102045]|uniref:hypothetical protein n=1 Tax=Alteribacillus sp. JSM 102045 TaxID=1562101 RepID=UPI0035C26B39
MNLRRPCPIDKMNVRLVEWLGILFQDPETQFCMLTVEDEIIFGLKNLELSKAEMEKDCRKAWN